MDNGHSFVSRGTNSHTLFTPAIYGHWLSARCLFFCLFLFNNHVLIVDIAHCSNMTDFFGFKKQNSVISQSFPRLTIVLYSHLIFFFCYKTFTSLLAFRRSHCPYLLPLCLPQSLYHYNMCPGRFFGRAHLLRPSGWYGPQGISPNCPY